MSNGVPGLASTLIAVATRPMRPLEIPAVAGELAGHVNDRRRGISLFGRRFEATVAPGRTIAGVVRDRKTGAPLSGLKVVGPNATWLEYPGFDRFFATTDARGHYRIDGYPTMEAATFRVEAPEDRPYSGREITLDVKEGDGPQALDFPLSRGVWITGRVVDGATGSGLGTQSIEYHAFTDNKYLVSDLGGDLEPLFDEGARTNQDGAFRIRGYPGRGIVTGGGGHDYLEGVGADGIAGLGRDAFQQSLYQVQGFSPYLRNTTIEVNIPGDAETFSCEVRLKKGKARVVRVVGPGGRPQAHLEASGLQNQVENPIRQVAESFFLVENLFPGEHRRVVAPASPKR